MKTRNSIGTLRLVRDLAPSDPISAWRLWKGDDTPTISTIKATLISGAAGEEVDASTADNDVGNYCQDFIILGAGSQVRRNAANAGTILKGESDYYNARTSGIDVRLSMIQCPKFEMVPNDTPLELVAPPGGSSASGLFPYGFIAPSGSAIKANFTNTRALAAGEGTVDIFIVFSGMLIGVGCKDKVSADQATADLVDAGLLSPRGALAPCGASVTT